jgi:hypothetical protein
MRCGGAASISSRDSREQTRRTTDHMCSVF